MAKKVKNSNLNFELQFIKPLTENQQTLFNLYEEDKHIIAYGSAGTGKNFCFLYLGLKDILAGNYQKIVIIRSVASCRDIGFLPGTEKDKLAVYEAPYRAIVNQLFNRDDAYDILKQKNIISFESTSFLRGLTYNNSILMLDEAANLTLHEASTVYTRVGLNTKLLVSGDVNQCDLNVKKEISGFSDIIRISKNMTSFGCVEFGIEDIVRSSFVKDFLIAKQNLGL